VPAGPRRQFVKKCKYCNRWTPRTVCVECRLSGRRNLDMQKAPAEAEPRTGEKATAADFVDQLCDAIEKGTGPIRWQ